MTDKKLPEMLCRWNAVEQMMRDAISNYSQELFSAEKTIQTIDALLWAATGRGEGLKKNQIDEIHNRMVWDAYYTRLHKTHPNDKRFNR